MMISSPEKFEENKSIMRNLRSKNIGQKLWNKAKESFQEEICCSLKKDQNFFTR